MTTTSRPSPLLSLTPLHEVLNRDPQRKIKFYSVKERKAEVFLPSSPSDFTLSEEHTDLSGMSRPSYLTITTLNALLYHNSRSYFSLLYHSIDNPLSFLNILSYLLLTFKAPLPPLPLLSSFSSLFLFNLFKGEDGVISIIHDEYSTPYCYDFFERRAFFVKTNADSM